MNHANDNDETSGADIRMPGSTKDAETRTFQFNLADLLIDTSDQSIGTIQKMVTAIPTSKPNQTIWFQAHPNSEYHPIIAGLKYGEPEQHYIATKAARRALAGELRAYQASTIITRAGDVRIWPILLPQEGQEPSTWTRSALEGIHIAKNEWIRMRANMALQTYEIYRLSVPLSAPELPALTPDELIRIAYRDRIIDSAEHPIVRQLLGLA